MRAIDLFAGAGGFTVGAIEAGAEVVWAANHWAEAVACHALNHPGRRDSAGVLGESEARHRQTRPSIIDQSDDDLPRTVVAL